MAQVKDSLTALVESALILVADLNVWFGDSNCPLDPLDMQNYACVLECMLIQWLRFNEGLANPLEDALCVALLILTVRATQALRRSEASGLHKLASKRLAKALSATSSDEWRYCPDLLLWILTIGAFSAEGLDEYMWFVYQASLACEMFEVHSVEHLLGRLHLCGWVSFKLDEAVHFLWDNILHLRLEPDSFDKNNVVGPLQSKVSEPDFVDWQNIDWVALSSQSNQELATATPSMGGEESLYDLGGYFAPPTQPAAFGMKWPGF